MAAFPFELVSPEKLLFSGEVEAVTAQVLEPSLKQVGMFVIYLLVLMVRPRGLFGKI